MRRSLPPAAAKRSGDKVFKLHAEFQKHNFFRRPNWRWERVVAIHDNVTPSGQPGKCSRRDDAFVKEAKPGLCIPTASRCA
jgi:hypothetical protein